MTARQPFLLPPPAGRRKQHRVSFKIGEACSWRIGYGVSSFLVAEGSGFSLPIGRALYRALRQNAAPINKPKRRRGVL
jgi:hypothetical protein